MPCVVQGGIYVSKVQANGPAVSALRIGDRIAAVNGIQLDARCEHHVAVTLLKSAPKGPVTLHVVRFAA